MTPLWMAASFDDLPMMDLLVQQGGARLKDCNAEPAGRVNTVDMLIEGLSQWHLDDKMVRLRGLQLLLRAGAKPSSLRLGGLTAAAWPLAGVVVEALVLNNRDEARRLIEEQAHRFPTQAELLADLATNFWWDPMELKAALGGSGKTCSIS